MCAKVTDLRSDTTYKYRNIADNNDYVWDVAWSISAEQINKMVKEYIRNYNGLLTAIMALPINEKNFNNTIWILEQFRIKNDFDINKITFLHYVSEDKDIIAASLQAEKDLNKFEIETNMRRDLYNLYMYISEQENILDADDAKYLEHSLRLFKRNGLHLPNDIYNEVKAINIELSDLCIEYEHNIDSDTTTIQLTRDELDGLPDTFFTTLEKVTTVSESELFTITTKYPHIIPIWENAKNEDTRRKVSLMYNSRCGQNLEILFKIIKLRQRLATILGYDSWANYILDMDMAKSSKIVGDFLNDLVTQLKPLRDNEIDCIYKMKKGKVQQHDIRYYMNKLKQDEYAVDHNIIRDYFPLDNVLKYMFKYFEALLHVRFTRGLKDSWNQDVWEWLVYDNATSKIIGKFYLDLFPRDTKFSHAACFPLKYRTHLDPYAICALVCNFTKPANNSPSLLSHEEVETLYHEFGHAMHNICALTKYSIFAGTKTQRDFVEMPSQMLENLCWEFNMLKKMSCHYKTKTPMSDELINALIATRNIGSGLSNSNQLLLGLTDQYIHTQEIKKVDDLMENYNKLFVDIIGLPVVPEYNKLAIFAHIVSGYDARYYGYLWSKVYADDIYEELKNNSKNSKEYRSKILEPGGSQNAIDMVYNFLGRKPSNKAFLKNLGIRM